MVTIESYFAFIIFVMGTILVAQDISKKEETKFIEDILDAHNYFRYKHASEPLKLDEKICKMAKKRTYEMRSTPYHSIPIARYAVNYSITVCDGTSGLDPFKIVSTWYEYGNAYDYNQEPRDLRIDIFSKMVWRSTKKIGVGILVCDKKCYVAVFYSPCGCQSGEYAVNILHPDVAAEINQQETNRLLGDLVKESD